MKSIKFAVLFILLTGNLFSQHKIRENDILFKSGIVRSIPLSYENNKKLFGRENLLVKILLDAYYCGEIKGYTDASFSESLSIDKLLYKFSNISEAYIESYSTIKEVELIEDLMVDKHRSEVILEPRAVSFMLSPEQSNKGLIEPLVYFKFEDCRKIFKKDARALAINPLMNGRNMNFTEVFLLHLYSSYIVKIGNENDPYFDQLKADKMDAFLLSKKEEHEISDYLYKLFNPK